MKSGYKQTEVGVIPDDWEALQLEQIGVFKNGINKSKEAFGAGFPFVNLMDVFGVSKVCSRDALGLLRTSAHERKKYELRAGDVLFIRSSVKPSGVGLTSVVAVDLEDTVFSGFLLRFRDSGRLDDLFKEFCFFDARFRQTIIGSATVSANTNINQSALRKLWLAIPPISEQRQIGSALSDADAAITSLERLIGKKRDMKQAATQQLMTGQTRLPGFSPSTSQSELQRTEIGIFPSEWQLVPLLKLIQPGRSIRYGIVQPGTYDPSGRYMIRGQDYSVAKGWASPNQVFRVSDKIEERYRNARVQASDLIMTIVGYCGHVEEVPDWLDGANLTQTTARLAIDRSLAVPGFVKAALNSSIGSQQVKVFLKGAAQPGLNCSDVERFLVPLPSIKEQEAIAIALAEMDKELSALNAQLEKMRLIKQAMMQELLTGRIRLSIKEPVDA
jgi:type I restriction enzyme S subunit